MSIAIGQKAKFIQPVIHGDVVDTRFNKERGELEHLISYTDESGELHQRWLLASQLEPI